MSGLSHAPMAPTMDLGDDGSELSDAFGGVPSLMGNAAMQSMMAGPDAFSPVLNAALGACFGDISGIGVSTGQDSHVGSFDAEATTIGSRIALGSGVQPDLGDPRSVEIIGHEVAHALAGGGSGAHAVDRPGDRGEASADQAGARFRDFVMGGMRGAAPSIAPAAGGQARVHRWEAGEHKHSVDDIANLAPGDADYYAGATTGARNQIAQPITLKNGVTLSAGEVTAMMGDFYGVVDPNTHALDIDASMRALQEADPEEMNRLLACTREEARTGQPTSTTDLEWITRHRAEHQSYLDMAQENDTHFSRATSTGTDNNMGCYNALHQRALDAAERGDANEARTYEAMAAHYLTDRHAAGHAFDKNEAMDQSGTPRGADGVDGKERNLYARLAHDDFNTNGTTLTTDLGSFQGLGDSHWADPANAANRQATYRSVSTSYDELDQVLNGHTSAADLAKRGYRANDTAPRYDPANQARANQKVRDSGLWDMATELLPQAPSGLAGWLARQEGQAENWIGDKWNTATDWVSGAWDTTTDAVVGGWNTATDWTSDRWDEATDWGIGAWNTTTDAVTEGWNTTTDAVTEGWNTATDWTGDRWNEATDWGAGAWNTTTDTVTEGWNTTTDAVGEGWATTTDAVGEGWTSTTDTLSSGWTSTTDWLGL